MINSTTNISMLNIEELMAEVIKVWRGLPDAYLEEICTSMRRMCTAIIRNNGYPITGVCGGIYYEGIYMVKVILTEIYMLEHFL